MVKAYILRESYCCEGRNVFDMILVAASIARFRHARSSALGGGSVKVVPAALQDISSPDFDIDAARANLVESYRVSASRHSNTGFSEVFRDSDVTPGVVIPGEVTPDAQGLEFDAGVFSSHELDVED